MDPIALLLASAGTLAVLLTYSRSITAMGAARREHKVAPPRMDGPAEFQAAARAQQNTLEYLVMIVPLIWMNALLIPVVGSVAAFLGSLTWSYYRISYIRGYIQSPEKRLRGFYGSLNALKFLLASSVVGMLYQLATLVGRL